MNKRQREVQQQFLDDEETVLRKLKNLYHHSLKDINGNIEQLMARTDADMQHVIYQVEYQKALKKQIEGILDNMNTQQFTTISEYLTKCYDEGFLGTMYDLQGQGIPLTLPIDQEAVVRAIQLDSKISNGLYSKLGEDVVALKKKIAAQVSRGISTGMSYEQVAKQISYRMVGTYNKPGGALSRAMTIARTEGHRIQVQSAMDACYKAKEKGADVVKQWDSTLDKKTRESHQQVDGQIRELDEKFSNGLMHPGDPSGGASEVVNCRCALLQRARWALSDKLSKIDNETGEIIDCKNYAEFKEKYLSNVERQEKVKISKVATKADIKQFEEYKAVLRENAPKTLDEFYKIKYNNSEEWKYIKGLYRYLSKYPNSQKKYYDIKLELDKSKVHYTGIPVKPQQIQAFILPSGTRDTHHIMKRMNERNITDDDVRSFVNSAKCMFSQWNGRRLAFYGNDGISIVSIVENEYIYKTVWNKTDFDETTEQILKVVNKYVE